MKKIVREGEAFPRGYGVAYRDYCMMEAVCYPFPLNYVVGLAVYTWNSIRCYPCKNPIRCLESEHWKELYKKAVKDQKLKE